MTKLNYKSSSEVDNLYSVINANYATRATAMKESGL
jgi:hypothetical protein